MGNNTINTTPQQTNQLFKQYSQIRKQKNGTILSHLQTGQTYFLRQANFINQKDYDKQLTRLQKQSQKQENQNIIKIVKYWGKQYNNFCSNSYKVYSVYEFPEITLLDQVAARQKEERFFQQCDLWSILQSCTNALADLKPTLSIQPSKVFIQTDGLLKVSHNDMTDDQYRCVVNQKIYYAPQKITNFNRPDKINSLQKEAVFSMGMTLLHASLLQDLYECYDYKNSLFIQQKLEQYLEALQERYSQSYIQAIATMLDTNSNRRPSLMQVQQILNCKWNNQEGDLENSFKPQRQTQDLKQSQTIANENDYYHNNYQKKSQDAKTNCQTHQVIPLGEVKNQVHSYHTGVYQPQINYNNNQYAYRASYEPTYNYQNHQTYNSYQSKENLFTDPKLLEMIRNDLKQISNKRASYDVPSNITVPIQTTIPSNITAHFNQNSTYVSSQVNYLSNTNNDCSRNSLGSMDYKKSSIADKSSSQLDVSMQNQRSQKRSEKISLNESKKNQEKDSQQNVLQSQEAKLVKIPANKSVNVPIFTTQQYEDGRYFEGMMINGVKQGHGKMYYQQGSFYQGNFKNDKMDGQGVLYYGQNKPAYEGQWLEDQFHGHGILYNQFPLELQNEFDYSDFNAVEQYWVKYQGQFNCDNKCGNGMLVLSNGQVFKGVFQNDCINGQGQFQNAHGDLIRGVWKNNTLTEIFDQ